MRSANRRQKNRVAGAICAQLVSLWMFACSTDGLKPVKVPSSREPVGLEQGNARKSSDSHVDAEQMSSGDPTIVNPIKDSTTEEDKLESTSVLQPISSILADLIAVSSPTPTPSPTANPDVMPTTSSAQVTESSSNDANISEQYNLSSSTATTLQRKSSEQLRSTIAQCVLGSGATETQRRELFLVKSEMFNSAGAPALSEGRQRFIMPNESVTQGVDVIQNQLNYIDLSPGSTGVRGDVVDDQLFLNSLMFVADVVAFNCDLNAEFCDCSSFERAQSMLQRCLPAFDTAAMASTMASAEHCGSSNLVQRRKAIASLISSYAFAAASK